MQPAALPRAQPARCFVWTHDVGPGVHGGTKATRDVNSILLQSGWEAFDTTRRKGWRGALDVLRNLGRLARTSRRSIFFVQHPAYGAINKLIVRLLVSRFPVVLLVHDLDSARRVTGGSSERLIDRATHIVTTGRLLDSERLAKASSAKLGAWDYLLAPGFTPPEWAPDGPVIFAGTLSKWKNGGLFACSRVRRGVDLYGTRYVPANNRSQDDRYHGPFDADRPSFKGPVGWGLVWEGSKESTEDALPDDYERLNQPHKLSLYLACGIPVIVWREAAAADFVRREQCGLLIDSLAGLESAIRAVSHDERRKMRERALTVGARMRAGAFLRQALVDLRLEAPAALAPQPAALRTAGAVA